MIVKNPRQNEKPATAPLAAQNHDKNFPMTSLLHEFYQDREKRLLALATGITREGKKVPSENAQKAFLRSLAGELAFEMLLPRDLRRAFFQAWLSAEKDPDIQQILRNGNTRLHEAFLRLLKEYFPAQDKATLLTRMDFIVCIMEGARMRGGMASPPSLDFLKLWCDVLILLFPTEELPATSGVVSAPRLKS